ncbi:NAD(P)H dehydrogenase [Segetibacter sp. 3557_3]|nr:NAD(P)H dehydrogenase [Segetibacter sp. 3557_3]
MSRNNQPSRPLNVLVINGHPRKASLSEALCDQYIAGATAAGTVVHRIDLYALDFEPNVLHHSPNTQFMEPGLVRAQKLIAWADHVVFVYPTWWGTMPAILKGFIDRVFTAGFAFEEIEGGTGYAPLLRGKTAQLMTTMDTPKLVYNLVYRAPGNNAMHRATLGFCGFLMLKNEIFSPVKSADETRRKLWLNKAYQLGKKLRSGALSPTQKIGIKAFSWFKAIRFQFYPMTFIAYAAGAVAAGQMGYGYSSFIFWVGYLWLFFLELVTVLSNDYVDYPTDVQNRFFGPFSGGSRVMVDKLLSPKEMRIGILASLILCFGALAVLLAAAKGALSTLTMTCLVLTIITTGYTIPPLRLSYRGLGEATVAFTHSFAVIVCGYIFQGGKLADQVPWLLSIPLFLSVLPSIMLAGIPDHDADKSVSKNTLAVLLGKKRVVRLAIFFTLTAALLVLVYHLFKVEQGAFTNLLVFVVPHALLIVYLLCRYLRNPYPPARIDGLLVAALSYILWFGLIPLINLM